MQMRVPCELVLVACILMGAAVHGAIATPVCSGAVCSAEINKLMSDGVQYCCPTSHESPSAGNYADPLTYSCSTTQDCSQLNRFGSGRSRRASVCFSLAIIA